MNTSLHSPLEPTSMAGSVDRSALQRHVKSALRGHAGIDVSRVAVLVDDAGRSRWREAPRPMPTSAPIEEAVKGVPVWPVSAIAWKCG